MSVFILHSQDAVQEHSWRHLRPGRRGSCGRNVSAAVALLASGHKGSTLHFHTLFTSREIWVSDELGRSGLSARRLRKSCITTWLPF